MIPEDEERRSAPPIKNLEEMSLEALSEYIGDLEREIDRAKTMIARKQETRGEAAALFNQKK